MKQGSRNIFARVVLIGFSGTGKSSVGQLVARRLGWDLLDTDAQVERREGTSIPTMFERKGESAFRELERAVFLEALQSERIVIATGGGAVGNDAIWTVLDADPATLVIRFDATPEEILRRLNAHREQEWTGETTRRPMLDVGDPLARIVQLKGDREGFYSRAHVTIPVANRTPERTADDIAELVSLGNGEPSQVVLDVGTAKSRIVVGTGTRELVTALLHERWPTSKRAWIAADAAVHYHHAAWLTELQNASGRITDIHVVPSGESSKRLAGLSDLYDWMLGNGVERSDVAVAAGGGVTGDLMGFASATVLRGIGLMQIPTTLLSMVDSSVGGKTGINHPAGKNLIGAFYQPSLVMVDPDFLTSLPQRKLRSGFAEIIKHGVIQASTPGGEKEFLIDVLDKNADGLLRLDEPLTSWVIRQNIELKASVVREDEKESHLRAILNFGHTIGHGIEAAGYSLLHGEAIAVGMIAAMNIAVGKDMVTSAELSRLMHLITAYGLPVNADVDVLLVREKMANDKKKSGGVQQWVLPMADGGVEIRADVSDAEIMEALSAVVHG